jgi:hypothetical protein
MNGNLNSKIKCNSIRNIEEAEEHKEKKKK